MIANEKPDDLLQALASLTSPAPAAARDARIRARCHAALTRQWPRAVRSALGNGASRWLRAFRPAPRTLDHALAGGAVVYGIAVVAAALRLTGLF